VSKYRLIHAEKACFPIMMMCRLLEVSRASYYAWIDRPASARAVRALALSERLAELHAASDGVYGAPRLLADLREEGVVVSGKTVAKTMRSSGLRGVAPRQWRTTTVPEPDLANIPVDRVQRQFDHGRLDAVWVGDILHPDLGRVAVPGNRDRRALPQGDRLGLSRAHARHSGHRSPHHGGRVNAAVPWPE